MTRDDLTAGSWLALCVHGGGGGGWEWDAWSRVFAARGFTTLAPDLEPSAAGLAATRFVDYREQVLVRGRDLARPGMPLAVVGASLGGLLALSVAAELGAAALVLVNPLPPAGVVARLPGEARPPIVPWGRQRSLASTRRALPDADDATILYALRRWRDESGAVLDEARAGIAVEPPRCPVLVLSSEHDDEVPPLASRALAVRLGADFESLRAASHVGPLLGTRAAVIAARVADWLGARAAQQG
jgi:pimeloyl-ACP methyl ester carboxylesterase